MRVRVLNGVIYLLDGGRVLSVNAVTGSRTLISVLRAAHRRDRGARQRDASQRATGPSYGARTLFATYIASSPPSNYSLLMRPLIVVPGGGGGGGGGL